MTPHVPMHRITLLLALATLAACDPAAGKGASPASDLPQAQVTQEGGRQVARFPSNAITAAGQVSTPAPARWTASGTDVLQSLGFAMAAAELPDGRVAVLDGMGDEILVLSPDGTLVDSWGGQGEGPQQFQVATAMFVVSDSLFVVDHGGARASYVDGNGDVTRLLSTMDGPSAGVSLVGRLSTGEWIGARGGERVAGREGVVDTLVATILVLDAKGSVVDPVGEYIERLAVLRSSPTMRTMVKLPYSPHGGVRTAGTWIAFHNGLDFSVGTVDRATGRRAVIEFDSVPPKLGTEGRARIVAAALDQVVSQQRPMMEQVWQRTPWPEHEGGLVGVHPTARGETWIGFVDSPVATVGGLEGRERWLLVDGQGKLTRAFSLDPGEQLLAISDSAAIVLARDQDGVQSIRRLGLP